MSRYYADNFHHTSPAAKALETDDITGSGCFVAGTMIFTAKGIKPIEKLKKGDIVVAFDKDGTLEHGYVQKVHKHKKDEQKDSIIKLTLENDTMLEVTANHGMWQDNGETPFIEARDLRVGGFVYDQNSNPIKIIARKTTSLAKQADDFCSYNLSVHPQHTYIADGIKVHNGGGDKGGAQHTPVESPNTLRSRTVARIQEVISEGEVEGLVDDGRSLFFDDTPILNQDDTPNFEDVSFFFFVGTPDQDSMPGFSAVEAEQVVNVEMQPPPSAGVIRTIPGGTDAVRVTIQLPGGLYNTNTETGDITGHTVLIKIETRLSGGVFEEAMTDTITGKTMTTYERAYRIDAPQPYDGVATWEVRCSRLSAIDAKATTKSVTYFARVTEIQEIQIAYPDTCLAGVTVDARSTGGKVPVRSYDMKGIKVKMPTNYDPITRIYTGAWTGAFKVEWTDNPAWIVYDLLTSTRYGLGDYIDETTIDKFSFYDASVYNDELVDDGDGGTEPRFTFNTQLATQEDSWKLIQAVASSMRATVLPGTILTLLQDRPTQAVKVINNANVIEGTFNYTGSPLAARKTVAHVTYNEPTDRYLPRTVAEENATGIARYGYNPTDIAAFGCTSEGQARRLARWVLDTELNTAEVVTFTVALDNADLLPGDIVKIMDRDYAGLELAGRVAGGSTTVIDLDRDVILNGGETYTFSVLDADGQAISDRTVTTTAGTVNQITITPALLDTGVALKNRPWLLSSDTGVNPRQFRVLFMRELEKGKFEISASQYDPTKYARVETGITLPAPIYSSLDGTVCEPISGLTYEVQSYVDPIFGAALKLLVKWEHNDPLSYKFKVQWRTENGNFNEPIYFEEKEYEIKNIVPGDYEVMINAVNTRGVYSVPVLDSFAYTPNVNNVMAAPINLEITPDTQDTSSITFATPDCSFRFENNPANDDVGGQNVFGGIAGYKIVIKDSVDNELEVREITSVPNNDPYYVTTFNFADNAATVGGPHRVLKVDVYTKTVDGALSPSPISATFTNPFPTAPTVALLDNPDGAFVQATPAGANKDTAGMVVCTRNTGGDFTPVIGDIVYQGKDLATQIAYSTPFESRSVKVAIYDDFSFDFGDLVFSTFGIQAAAPYGIASVTTLPTLPNALFPDGVVVYLTTDKKLYRVTLNGTVWDRSADGADLVANSVTTNQILAGTIVAADISSGTLTTASGVFGAASIGNASIGVASIDTLNLVNDAATNVDSTEVGSGAGTSFGAPNGTWKSLASATVNVDSNGRGLVIITVAIEATVSGGSPTHQQFIAARIRRVTGPTVVIWEGLSDAGNLAMNKNFAQIKGSFTITDEPAPGTMQYQVQVYGYTPNSGGNFYYNTSTITALEAKK